MFGRIGDKTGRKVAFLLTVSIMGGATVLVGLLPGYAQIGILAPIILVTLRMLQGLALGGEYGGAAIYVAEHAPDKKRGLYTSWIQTTATIGLFLALAVILFFRVDAGRRGVRRLGLARPVPPLRRARDRRPVYPAATPGDAAVHQGQGAGQDIGLAAEGQPRKQAELEAHPRSPCSA